MLAFPSMLTEAAKTAGMKTPDLSKTEEWDREAFPHFTVFCGAQLERPMSSPTEHWDNAKIIAAIPDDRIRQMTVADLLAAGLKCVFS